MHGEEAARVHWRKSSNNMGAAAGLLCAVAELCSSWGRSSVSSQPSVHGRAARGWRLIIQILAGHAWEKGDRLDGPTESSMLMLPVGITAP